jgi:hypothetical protein
LQFPKETDHHSGPDAINDGLITHLRSIFNTLILAKSGPWFRGAIAILVGCTLAAMPVRLCLTTDL